MNLFGKWKEQATEYVDVRVQLAKLKFIERASHVIGNLMLGFAMLITMIAVLIFLGIGIMETLTVWFDGSRIGAAFTTSAIFLVFVGIIYSVRKTILTAIAGIFIRVMTDPGDDDDDDSIGKKKKKENLDEEL